MFGRPNRLNSRHTYTIFYLLWYIHTDTYYTTPLSVTMAHPAVIVTLERKMPTTELKSQVGGLAHGPNTISTLLLIGLKMLTIIFLCFQSIQLKSKRKGLANWCFAGKPSIFPALRGIPRKIASQHGGGGWVSGLVLDGWCPDMSSFVTELWWEVAFRFQAFITW